MLLILLLPITSAHSPHSTDLKSTSWQQRHHKKWQKLGYQVLPCSLIGHAIFKLSSVTQSCWPAYPKFHRRQGGGCGEMHWSASQKYQTQSDILRANKRSSPSPNTDILTLERKRYTIWLDEMVQRTYALFVSRNQQDAISYQEASNIPISNLLRLAEQHPPIYVSVSASI